MIRRMSMTRDRKTIRNGGKPWNDSIRDIGAVGKDGGETVSEGISRLNKSIRDDKRNLRRKKPTL
jgi:hypothetical protein